MAAATGAVPALFLLLAMLVLPPAAFVAVAWWRLGQARARGGTPAGYVAVLGLAAAGLAFNLVVIVKTVPGVVRGDIELGLLHLAALAVSWLWFWGALVFGLWVGRRRRRRVY